LKSASSHLHEHIIPEQQLVASLRGEEAKLWIHESEVEAQLGEDCSAILYPPWQHATDSGVGLLAPVGKEIAVCGGWLDAQGNAHRNPSKLTAAKKSIAPVIRETRSATSATGHLQTFRSLN
jgi:hypothetical protein